MAVVAIAAVVLAIQHCLRGCHGLSDFDPAEFRRLLQTQDGFLLGDEEIRPAERDVRLEDFFWTGASGDGPPYHMRRPEVIGSADAPVGGGGFNFVRTSTMFATVYVNGDFDEDDDHRHGEQHHHVGRHEQQPEVVCARDCDYTVVDDRLGVEREEEAEPAEVPEWPEDRRFWLLTILSGHYDVEAGIAMLQERLASLYRLAFSRQHLWHLGVDTLENPLEHIDTSTVLPSRRTADFDADEPASVTSVPTTPITASPVPLSSSAPHRASASLTTPTSNATPPQPESTTQSLDIPSNSTHSANYSAINSVTTAVTTLLLPHETTTPPVDARQMLATSAATTGGFADSVASSASAASIGAVNNTISDNHRVHYDISAAIDIAISRQRHLHRRNAPPSAAAQTPPPPFDYPEMTEPGQTSPSQTLSTTPSMTPAVRMTKRWPSSAQSSSSGIMFARPGRRPSALQLAGAGAETGKTRTTGSKISVLVHNITLLSAANATKMETPVSVASKTPVAQTATTAPAETTATTNGSTVHGTDAANSPASSAWSTNQTEIVYAVFVDGKPVLAATAAADMQLVSEAEVAHVMAQMVHTKAEPYLRQMPAKPPTPSAPTSGQPTTAAPPPVQSLPPTTSPPTPEAPTQRPAAVPVPAPSSTSAPSANITALLDGTAKDDNILAALVQQHPIWIGVIGAVILLLILGLLLGLAVMTRSKRLRSAQVKRLTSRRTLIDDATQAGGPSVRMALVGDAGVGGGGTGGGIGGIGGYGEMVEAVAYANAADGLDNFGYANDIANRAEREHVLHQRQQQQQQLEQQPLNQQRLSGKGDGAAKRHVQPVIHFPKPPAGSPTSSSTSDSSIYYPHGRTRLDIQSILDEKSVHRFRKEAQLSDLDETNATYAQIEKKPSKSKLRKKYMKTSNRVGSLEKDGGSDPSDPFTSGADDEAAHHYERVEAINTSVPVAGNRYHQNKLLSEQAMFDAQDDGLASADQRPNDAVNPEMLRCIDHRLRTSSGSGSGSIGSYLSMASVRSFPRYAMPQPMHKVLEPLSVTHLDQQSEAGLESARSVNRHQQRRSGRVMVPNEAPVASGFVVYDPQAFNRTRSDGADPGVLGPVVWEMHKQQMQQQQHSQDVLSPMLDPVKTRNRFEGLLEGAINLYEEESAAEITQREAPTRGKDARLKTAIPTKKPSTAFINRPHTGGAVSTIDALASATQPLQSSNRRAWGSTAPTPLVRPLSAGPFHRPEIDVLRVLAPTSSTATTVLSTAPLIEAIQKELRKFDKLQPTNR